MSRSNFQSSIKELTQKVDNLKLGLADLSARRQDVSAHRLAKQQSLVKNLLAATKGLLVDCKLSDLISQELYDKAINKFEPQTQRLNKLTFSCAFVGAMKAGKSSSLNSIVGWDVVPKRITACTTIPTNYLHVPSQEEPKLLVPIATEINNALAILKAKFEQINETADSEAQSFLKSLKDIQPELVDQITEDVKVQDSYDSEEDVREALTYINDIVRLLLHPLVQEDNEPAKETASAILSQLKSLDSFPKVIVCFKHPLFSQYTTDVGTLSLIDTPGPNEAMEGLGSEDSSFLIQVKQLVLQQVTTVVLVSDATQLYTQDEAKLRREVAAGANRLYVILNKMDVYLQDYGDDEREQKISELKEAYPTLFKDQTARFKTLLSPEHVFLTTAVDYLYAAWALDNFAKLKSLSKDSRWTRLSKKYKFKVADVEREDLEQIVEESGFVPFLEQLAKFLLSQGSMTVIREAAALVESILSKVADELSITLVSNEQIDKSEALINKASSMLDKSIYEIRGLLKSVHDSLLPEIHSKIEVALDGIRSLKMADSVFGSDMAKLAANNKMFVLDSKNIKRRIQELQSKSRASFDAFISLTVDSIIESYMGPMTKQYETMITAEETRFKNELTHAISQGVDVNGTVMTRSLVPSISALTLETMGDLDPETANKLAVGWIIKEIDPAKVFQAVQYMAFDYLGGVEMGLPKKLQSIFINAVKKYERSSKKILQNLSRSVSLRRRNSTALIGQEVAMAASALTIVKQLRGVASELTQ